MLVWVKIGLSIVMIASSYISKMFYAKIINHLNVLGSGLFRIQVNFYFFTSFNATKYLFCRLALKMLIKHSPQRQLHVKELSSHNYSLQLCRIRSLQKDLFYEQEICIHTLKPLACIKL